MWHGDGCRRMERVQMKEMVRFSFALFSHVFVVKSDIPIDSMVVRENCLVWKNTVWSCSF